MQLDITDLGPCKKSLKFALTASQVDQEFDDKFEEVAKTVPLPGFRVGKAPHHLLEKRFGEIIAKEVTAKLVQDNFEKAIEENSWAILGEPDFAIPPEPAVRGQDYGFAVTFEVRPEVTAPDLGALEAVDPYEPVTAEMLERACNEQIRRLGKAVELEAGAKVTAGCLVTARVSVCAIEDGDEQEFFADEDVAIDVESPRLAGIDLPELAAALRGKTTGDKGTVEFTIPQDFSEEEWRGLPGNVAYDIVRIQRVEVPVLDEALAKRQGQPTVAAWREAVRTSLEEAHRAAADRAIEASLLTQLLETTPLELPQGIVERSALEVYRSRYGDSASPDHDGAEWQQLVADASTELRGYFLIEAIAEAELVHVSEADVDRRIAVEAAEMRASVADVRKAYEGAGYLNELRRRIRASKTQALIRQKARIK